MPDHVVVANFFGSRFQSVNKPPHQRLIEKQCQSDTLDQVPNRVVAAQVREFMSERLLHWQWVGDFTWHQDAG